MKRISSNATLFVKLFIPIFWAVFFGLFTIVIFSLNSSYYGTIPGGIFRMGTLGFYLIGIAIMYFTLFQLKRVEISARELYTTDYFKHYKYPILDVERISSTDFGLFRIGKVTLKAPGSFGKSFRFLVYQRNFRAFWENHPLLNRILREGDEAARAHYYKTIQSNL